MARPIFMRSSFQPFFTMATNPDFMDPLTHTLSKLTTSIDFAMPNQQRQRSKSFTMNFETPGSRVVKPVPSAFHSTGLISKKNRPKLNSHITPDTPIKQKQTLQGIWKAPVTSSPVQPVQPLQPFSVPPASIRKPTGMFSNANFKTNRLQRSPLKESPTKIIKRPHLIPASPISGQTPKPAARTTCSITGSPLDSNMSFESPISNRKSSQFYQTESPIPKSNQIPDSCFGSTPIKSRNTSLVDQSPPVVSKTFFSKLVKDKHRNFQHSIPFSTLISRSKLVITDTFFDALDGKRNAIAELNTDSKQDFDYFETRFQLLARLGHGAFADAFHVLSLDDQCEYAVKKTRQPFLGFKDAYFLLIRVHKLEEVKMLLKVGSHPCCVSLKQAWIQYGYIYIQMELCNRGRYFSLTSLSSYLDEYCVDGPLSEEQIWRIMKDIIQVFQY